MSGIIPTSQKNPEDTTFQLTVGQLTLSSPLIKPDIHITVGVGDLSKITCSGESSEDGLIITWNHPFLFTAHSSATVYISICNLPEELSSQWDKEPIGDQMITNVASLLESNNTWICGVSGLSAGPATLSIMCKTSDVLITPNGHNCISSLQEYSYKLFDFEIRFTNVSCTSTKIEVDLARLDLCPIDHPAYIVVLSDLATGLANNYYQEHNITNLNRAIEILETILYLYPSDHPNHAETLESLSICLLDHYIIQRNKNDLNKLKEIQEKWLALCPLGHSRHPIALGEYAKTLLEHYYAQGNIADLDRAIEMAETALNLCPPDHPDHPGFLAHLSMALNARYNELGNLSDLNQDIDLKEQYLELCPPLFHGIAIGNLALSLCDHYEKAGNHSDLNRAIMLFKEASEFYPVYHHHFASNAAQLAKMMLLSSNTLQADEIPSAIDEAFETYRLLKKCGPAASSYLLYATQSWIYDAERYNHSSVLEAYQTSLNTLDHFTSFNSSLDSRHETMQMTVADIANNAFSCATRHGDLQMAVEFLEQGRGILWNQLARFDISVTELEAQGSQGQELGRKFTRLSADLRKHAQGSGSKDTSPYWRVQEQWRLVVEEIRHLDGFSRFLLPPRFEDLEQAAECGPVIVVNASKYTCDALIVLYSRAPVHVLLPCSLADVKELYGQLCDLTQNAHAYAGNRESYVKQMLRELWSSAVEPIASVLRNDIQLPLGSRIWWCPTSTFTTLPLHAAGPYRKGQQNFMDLYVSSYAPSLSGLVRTRERIRAQKGARDAVGLANVISFAAVGQARPSADIKLSELVEVEHEIRMIRDETGMPPNMTFEAVTGEVATIDGAVQAFRDHRWVHVACHGAQHAEKPFESWFAMGDGKLTLKRIIQERYTNSEFAFLSACHTAVGDASTPDEVLHLAGGMQFAGFNGVIGTLWRVDDAVAHRFVTRFYKEMFKYPTVDFEHAAVALNTVAVEAADEVSLEKRIVFVHIGI